MYKPEYMVLYFHKPTKQEDMRILAKDITYLPEFTDKINAEFNAELETEDLTKVEFELPLVKSKEMFNCPKDERIYFNHKLDKTW